MSDIPQLGIFKSGSKNRTPITTHGPHPRSAPTIRTHDQIMKIMVQLI